MNKLANLSLPWSVYEYQTVRNCDKEFVCSGGYQNENAAIVRAVNNHDALVEALRNLLADTQHAEHNCGDEDCPVAKARALLAKIGGEG